jgi:hypothetical protein
LAITHPINGQVVKKKQSKLTLQQATKVVEGKMHILPEFFTENNSYINVLNVFGLASSVTL